MEDLISTFHIDWKLMIAQLINFGLVFFVLYLIAAKPLTKLMKSRTEEITTGLENAEKAKIAVANADLKKQEIVRTARKEAKEILDQSHFESKEIVQGAKEQAILEKNFVLEGAKKEIEKEKLLAQEKVQQEASVLVVDGIKKVLENYLTKEKGEEIIKEMLKS